MSTSTVEHSTAWKAVADAGWHAKTLCQADLASMSLEDRTAMARELIAVRARLTTALEQCGAGAFEAAIS